jgi:signal transduction histidine kinase
MFWRKAIYFLLILFFCNINGHLFAASRDFPKQFEIHFFVISQSSSPLDIESVKNALTIPENSTGLYYKNILQSLIAYKLNEYQLFDSLLETIKTDLPVEFKYDTLGYFHYLQYRQHYLKGEHKEAMEQLIYAKEVFKRNQLAMMTLECMSHYYGNYANSIFSTMRVEDFTEVESQLTGTSYILNEGDSIEFWAKMMIWDRLGVLLGLDGQLDRSEKYLKYVIEKTGNLSNKRLHNNAVGNLSINQYKNKNYRESIENALIDLDSSLESGLYFSSAGLGVLLAKNYLEIGQPSVAWKYIVLADTFSLKLNGIFEVDILETKAEYFRKIGNVRKSNEFFQEYLGHKDSINLNAIHEMEFRMNTEQEFFQKVRKYEAENLRNQATIKAQKQKNIIVSIVLAFLLIFTLVIGFMLRNIKNKNKLLRNQQKEILETNEALQAQKEELKTQNETITELNKTLEVKVIERTRDLEEKTKIIEAFLYQMSHRFRAPIANLKGLINLIGIEKKPTNTPKYIELSNESINKLDSLLTHIKQLLEFDKTQKDSIKFNIYDLVNEEILALKNKYKDANIKIVNNLNKNNAPELFAVREYHKVVISEILDNACKFSKLKEKTTGLVTINEEFNNSNYKIIIQDNGPGILTELWERVFEPFFVGNESSKGDGLGIYVASIAANKTGTKIDLDSSVKSGTRMIITIPRDKKIN